MDVMYKVIILYEYVAIHVEKKSKAAKFNYEIFYNYQYINIK
ncbi:MAG: hypothetical protein Fur0028_13970 [Bacteroidales bacterium]